MKGMVLRGKGEKLNKDPHYKMGKAIYLYAKI
jgi:hypothetical protein